MAYTKTELRRIRLVCWSGFLLTAIVVLLDASGFFSLPEGNLYDIRAYYCQLASRPPTTQFVHLDIDDTDLAQMGKWPWPYAWHSLILDELRRAGCTALAADILLTESENREDDFGASPTTAPASGENRLAGSIKSFRNLLLPASLTFFEDIADTPVRTAVRKALKGYPDLDNAQLFEMVKKSLSKSDSMSDKLLRDQIEACANAELSKAVFNNIQEIADHDPRVYSDPKWALDDLRRKLFPSLPANVTISSKLSLLRQEYAHVRALNELARLSIEFPPSMKETALQSKAELMPIYELGSQMSHTGFVDYLNNDEPVVRRVPLVANVRGRLMPQMAFNLALAFMGVQLKDVDFQPDKITFKKPDGSTVIIPVHYNSYSRIGQIPFIMDIPWFGTRNWQTMYDYPRHEARNQHQPVMAVWAVVKERQQFQYNVSVLQRALIDALTKLNDPGSKDMIAQINSPRTTLEGLAAFGKSLLKDRVDSALEAYEAMKPSDKTSEDLANEKTLRDIRAAVPSAIEQANKGAESLSKKEEELKKIFGGKAVIYGFIATGTIDTVTTPIHNRAPGVTAHGAVFNAIVSGNFLVTMPYWVTALITLIIGLIATIAVAFLPPVRAFLLAAGVTLGYVLFNGFVVYDLGHRILGLTGPLVVGIVVTAALTFINFLIEKAERNRITKRFRSYVDPKLVQYVIENPEKANMEGTLREMSVVFTDLEGFTTLSEVLKERTVPMLSDYMGEMVPLIRSHNGYVNKFLGDGIMFFFNAPYPNDDHAADAVAAVLDMQRAMVPFNEKLKTQKLPILNMRVGIVSGDMVVGDAGPETASDYTVLGDNVNLSSRLEGANKATGTNTLIHWRTRELLGERYLCRPIGRLQVKGKTEGVMVYEPMSPITFATDAQRRTVELSRQVVDAYLSADFDKCVENIKAMEKELRPSKFSKLYYKEAEARKNEFAQEGFDPTTYRGVITLSEK